MPPTTSIAHLPQSRFQAAEVKLSVVVPVYNEEGNIPLLCKNLFAILDTLPFSFEVIAVNDGSRDRSIEELLVEAEHRPGLKVVDLRRNYGQTAATMAGIDHASGEIIVTIDADLQNDPEDIPALIDELEEGYDVVSGWRKDRKGRRHSPQLRQFDGQSPDLAGLSGVKLNDYGCTLKAYRREVLERNAALRGDAPFYTDLRELDGSADRRDAGPPSPSQIWPLQIWPRAHRQGCCWILMVVKFLDRHFVKPIYVFGWFWLLFCSCCRLFRPSS